VELIEDAQLVAESLVKPLGRRWDHVQSVARRASELAPSVMTEERELLVAAAWLHDIGYSPQIGDTHFHPLDGARYLQDKGWPDRIVRLVAHHSGARFEAAERGLSDALQEFPFRDDPVLDALAMADLTTGPNGQRLSYDERIREILSRYEPDHPVHQAWTKAAPIMREAVERTEHRLAEAQPK
jgi:putative nucleotidyltransferase with HDIG domain